MKSHVVEMVLPLKLSPARPNGREKFTGQTHDFCGKPKIRLHSLVKHGCLTGHHKLPRVGQQDTPIGEKPKSASEKDVIEKDARLQDTRARGRKDITAMMALPASSPRLTCCSMSVSR